MPIKSFNYYQTLEVEVMDIEIQCKDNIREDPFVKGLVPQKVIEEWNCSWDFADFGPFHEDMIDENNRCILPLVHSNEQAIVPDIYMPEILLHIIAEVEETNRLLFLSQIFVRMLFIQERQNGSKELCCLDF